MSHAIETDSSDNSGEQKEHKTFQQVSCFAVFSGYFKIFMNNFICN